MHRVSSPSAITLGKEVLLWLVWSGACTQFLSGAAPRGWLQVKALFRLGFWLLCVDPSPVLPGLHSAGPPEALPTFLPLLLPSLPQGWPRLRNRRLRGLWGEVSLVPTGLPPSRSTRDCGSPHVPL